jgi:hypothetical protein
MVGIVADIPQDMWEMAVSRLNQFGVFADEERGFPGSSMLHHEFGAFETTLRSKGYTGGPMEIEEIDQPKNGVSFLIFDQAKHGDVRSAAVAWEQEYWDRWHKLVADSVTDWLQRLDALKVTMQSWLPVGMSIVDLTPTPMNEELMRKFRVAPVKMPTFEVRKGPIRIMKVQPKGLWIIGANGRVDLITATASYILVDQSQRFCPSDWRYYTSTNRRVPTALDKTQFVSLLN